MIDEKHVKEAIGRWKSGDLIRNIDFEKFVGLGRRPEFGSFEWAGYVRERNVRRVTLNGFAMEHPNERELFQIRPALKEDMDAEEWADEENRLIFLRGDKLFASWNRQQTTRVLNAPRRFIEVMETLTKDFALPMKTRHYALNQITGMKVIQDVADAFIKSAAEDPEFRLPDYSKAELLRLTVQAADESLNEEVQDGPEADSR